MKIKRDILGTVPGTVFGTIEFVLTDAELEEAYKEYLLVKSEETSNQNDWETHGIFGYAEKWWNNNGYQWKLKNIKRGKHTYAVCKDGHEMEFEITPNIVNFKKYMELFKYTWDLDIKIKPDAVL